jgi:hypothetical protein
MAGYHIYSLDWDRFLRFVDTPSLAQVRSMAELVSDGLDECDQEFEENDPLRDWSSEPDELSDPVRERLARPDWYGDLSDVGKGLWERALTVFCDDARPREIGFRVESDGVYWDVIEIARLHGIPPNRVTTSVLSHFGTRPYRYHPPAGRTLEWGDWTPNHSMHTPEEVRRLLEELREARAAILSASVEVARSDYEEELLPGVERIAHAGRLLYIAVDT